MGIPWLFGHNQHLLCLVWLEEMLYSVIRLLGIILYFPGDLGKTHLNSYVATYRLRLYSLCTVQRPVSTICIATKSSRAAIASIYSPRNSGACLRPA